MQRVMTTLRPKLLRDSFRVKLRVCRLGAVVVQLCLAAVPLPEEVATE